MRNIAATLALAFAASPVLADNAVPRGGSSGDDSSSAGMHHSSGSSGGDFSDSSTASVLFADNAVPRGGGSSGGSSSSGEHHGSGVSSSSGGSSSGGSSGSYSDGGSRSSSSTTAQRRHPRAGTGTGSRNGRYSPYYGGGYYGGYSPWYPWYYPSDYAYGPYWGAYYYGYWPYGAYYSGGGGGGYSRTYRSYRSGDQGNVDTGGVRVLVDPEDAKVYVDGYYAGKVDDFDGIFQRLNLAEGRHEMLLKRDGYRSARYRIYVSAGTTTKIEHDMVKGEGEEPLQDLTGGRGGDDRGAYAGAGGGDLRRDDEGDVEPPRPRRGRDDDAIVVRPDGGNRPGYLRLDVQPSDASIYVDGEFRGTAKQIASLELSRGPHRVEIVRPGFRTELREIMVDPGQTRDLEVELARP